MKARNLSLELAISRLTELAATVGAEVAPVSQGRGRVLAEPVVAAFDQPPFAASAMDGWAVRAADLQAASPENPVDLRRIGEAPAGRPFIGALGPGQAVRIFTGGAIPAGADAVAMQEDVTETADGGRFVRPLPVGRHIRPAGQDFAAGQLLIDAGERLTAGGVGLAAAAGRAWLSVRRRPRVGVLATGDEIALPGDTLGAGRIVSSNAFAIAALVESWGGDAVHLGVVADRPEALQEKLRQAAGLDLMIVCSGGGGGAYDVMARLGDADGGWENWRLALRPCRAVTVGRTGPTPVLGLPGNPTPSFIGAFLLAEPMVRRLAGANEAAAPRRVVARATTGLEPTGAETVVYLARLSRRGSALTVDVLGGKGGAALRSIANADALIVRGPESAAAGPGALVETLLITA